MHLPGALLARHGGPRIVLDLYLAHPIILKFLCGASFVTLPRESWGNETVVVYWVVYEGFRTCPDTS